MCGRGTCVNTQRDKNTLFYGIYGDVNGFRGRGDQPFLIIGNKYEDRSRTY